MGAVNDGDVVHAHMNREWGNGGANHGTKLGPGAGRLRAVNGGIGGASTSNGFATHELLLKGGESLHPLRVVDAESRRAPLQVGGQRGGAVRKDIGLGGSTALHLWQGGKDEGGMSVPGGPVEDLPGGDVSVLNL